MLKPYLPEGAKFHFIGNPIQVRREPPIEVVRNQHAVCVGRLESEKGVHLLVDAARITGTKVTFIGDGALRSYAESLDGARVTGWLQRDHVMQELESARCLVFPSSWYETYGLVVDEAAARGIPSIVSDVSAAAERVADGITGWHFRSGDKNDLARCLRSIEDDEALKKIGAEAYKQYWEHPHSPTQHAAELLRVYRDLLRATSSRTG